MLAQLPDLAYNGDMVMLGLVLGMVAGSDFPVLDRLYSVISGPAGQKRDWDAFRGLFAEGAQMRAIAMNREGKRVVVLMTPEDYIKRSGPFLESQGFFEKEVKREVKQYGPIAQVWSAYEARQKESDEKPMMSGVNLITLVKVGEEWKVASIVWADERATKEGQSQANLQSRGR